MEKSESEQPEIKTKNNSLSIDDFFSITVIGQGSYAKVLLVKKIDNGKLYALKILKKKYVEYRKQETHVFNERNILVDIDHPFIIKLEYSF